MGTVKVIQGKEAFEIIKSAVDKCANLVRLTFGPASNKVLIHTNMNRTVIDDGVQIMRDIELEDENENAVKNTIKEVSIRTNDRVGDGTTGALIMLQAIIKEVAERNSFDGREVEQELKRGAEEAKKQLLALAKPVKTKDELYRVARISFDDPEIAELIADSWYKLGTDGVITVERSGTMETSVDMADGLKIARGYISPYMVNDAKRMQAEVEKPHFLLTTLRLTEVGDILPVMDMLVKNGVRSLVVFCDNMESAALATVNANGMFGKNPQFHCVAVNAPFSGDERLEWLEDLAVLTGGKVFTEGMGDKLENATLEDLGNAERFICTSEESVIVKPKGSKKKVNASIKQLKSSIKAEKKEEKKEKLRKRLASFTNKIAVIKVGANTEAETKALQYKVDDAIHATLSAFKSGVVAGGGFGLAQLKTSSRVLNAALKRPMQQLAENVGQQLGDIEDYKKGEAVNVVAGDIGDFRKVGVMDPVDVLVAQIESATSIAGILLTTKGLIVEHKDKNNSNQQ